MTNLWTMVSAGALLLLMTCDSAWGKTGGGGGGYYGGYGNSGKGKGNGKSSCKGSDKYSDIPCDEFEVSTPRPSAAGMSPSVPSPAETEPSPSVPSEPSSTQPPTDSSPSQPETSTESPPETSVPPPTPSNSPPTDATQTESPPPASTESPPETSVPPPMPSNSPPTDATTTKSPPPATSPSGSSPSDSPSPSDWVTSSVCKTDSGAYGSQTGRTSLATFGYEIETRGSGIDLETDVLPAMEVSFNDFLLPTLFPGTCSFRRLQSQQHRRRLAVIGLRADPPDTVDADALCETSPEAGNSCGVVDGAITLISEGDLFLVNQEIARDALKAGMQDDAFLYIHPDIVRVSYREPNDEGTPEATGPDEGVDIVDDGATGVDREVNTMESGDDDNNAVLIGTVTAAAAVAILLFGVLFARRRRRGDGEESSLLSLEPSGNFPSTPPRTT